MEPTSLTLITIIMICVFIFLGIWSKSNGEKVGMTISFVAALMLLVFFPMKGDTKVLYEYNFSNFQTHGIIEYISPFDSTLVNKKITTIEIYNKLAKDEDLLIRAHYSLFGIMLMETFVQD